MAEFSRRNWNRKPPFPARVDRLHPIGRSLIAAWVANEGSGATHEAVSGRTLIHHGGVTWQAWDGAPALKFDGTTGYVEDSAVNIPAHGIIQFPNGYPYAGYTVVVRMVPLAAGSYPIYFDRAIGTGTANWSVFSWAGNRTPAIGPTGSGLVIANTAWVDGQSVDVVFEQVQSGGSYGVTCYMNGRYDNIGTSSQWLPTANGVINIGRRSSDGAFGAAFILQHAYIFERHLSALEVKELYESPYSIFRTSRNLVAFSAPTGPQTITPAAAIPTGESWGTPKIAGPISIAAAIPTAENWPTPVVMYPREIFPVTIPTGVSWFSPVVTGPVSIATIPSAEHWPTPFLNIEQILVPTLIPSGETWYPPNCRVGSQRIFPTTIPSGESWPSPTIRGGPQWIRISTIPSGERWFRPTVTGGDKTLTLLISGKDRTSYMRAAENMCHVDSQTMGRWSLSLDLYDATQSFIPIEGQTIQLIDLGRRLFAGCIQSVETDRFMGTVSNVVYHVTATDKSSIMDHRVVTKDYLMADWIDYADVVRDIALNFLNGEGFDTSGVPGTLGPLTQDYAQNLAKVSDLYSQIARDTGTVWWTDDAVITFSPMVDLPAAPFALTETSRNWANLKVTRTTQDFYNKIYVRSNLQIIPSGTGPSGGGSAALQETITFTAGNLNVQMQASQPTGVLTSLGIGSVVSMTVNGHVQTVVDFAKYTGQTRANLNDYLWFFGEGNNLLSFTYGPPSNAVVVVTYIPGSPKLGTTIAQYGTALNPLDPMGAPLGTCGSGLYEGVVQVNDISDQAELDAIAVHVLARLGTIPSVVSYETDHPGMRPGQIQSVNVPNSNIASAQILVTRVRGTYAPPDNSRVDYLGNPTGSSFRWAVEGTTNLDPGSNSANYYARLIERTGHPLPLPRYEDVTFAIDPGGSVSSGLSKANPYPVKQTGLGFEIVWSWAAAPVDQDLIVMITRNGAQIMQITCSQFVGANLNTTIPILQFNQLYLYRGDILNVDTAYSVTGAAPTPASSVTFVVRWSY